ncbi:MAG: amino acid ABC transporter permease [Clostridia bacterium]|nr:amino acid ABC transporter permease [Clostridia bacterium]
MEKLLPLFLNSFWPLFKAGLLISVPLMLVSFAIGLVVAFAVALMRMSKWKPLQAVAWLYVWVIRGTPLIVQIFVIYFGLAYVGIVLAPIPSAILALTISQGAYNSEVIRAALSAIPRGQFEACKALGMNKFQTMVQVIIPQAALVAVPSLGNSFISLLKDTSLVATITVREIFQTAQQIVAVSFEPLLLYLEAAVVYLIFSTVLTKLQSVLEKKLGKHLVDTRV